MLFRKTFPVGPLQCNCTILGDSLSREAVVIDPGDEAPRIVNELVKNQLRVKALVHTHAHIDHIGATADVAEITGATAFLHEGDFFLHQMLPLQAQLLGLAAPKSHAIEHTLVDGGAIAFGAYHLGIIHTPGHTPGSVCFNLEAHDLCFAGDTLFRGGIGRTDLWGGDGHAIVQSIKQRLYSLNSAVEVIPGHGPNTTIERERSQNPFVRL